MGWAALLPVVLLSALAVAQQGSSVATVVREGVKVSTVVNHGPDIHCIDLVFLSEGYLASEEAKFHEDVQHLLHEVLSSHHATLLHYFPLFNVHTLFLPSAQSGVSSRPDGNTAFQLYRQGSTLRSILPSNSSYARAESMCQRLAPGCDFTVLLANDDFYGGLGDRVTIVTSSKTSGPLALRHELAHVFGDMGEEYDGGGDYSGTNYALSNRICQEGESPQMLRTADGEREVWPCISWGAWLTEQAETTVPAQPVQLVLMRWPWYELSPSKPYHIQFSWPAEMPLESSQLELHFSASHVKSAGRLQLAIDGRDAPFKLASSDDRMFYTVALPVEEAGAAAGNAASGGSAVKHVIVFRGGAGATLCHLALYVYGPGYVTDRGYVGAYPIFSANGKQLGYRPTHDSCLMRDMNSHTLCPVCKERLWARLLAKASLLHGVDISVDPRTHFVSALATTARFGKYRIGGTLSTEAMHIQWIKLTGSQRLRLPSDRWTLTPKQAYGCWEVTAELWTAELPAGRYSQSLKQSLFVMITSHNYWLIKACPEESWMPNMRGSRKQLIRRVEHGPLPHDAGANTADMGNLLEVLIVLLPLVGVAIAVVIFSRPKARKSS